MSKGWKFTHANGAISCLPWAWTIGAKLGPTSRPRAVLGVASRILIGSGRITTGACSEGQARFLARKGGGRFG
jgi:hypothetical protein